MDVLREQVHTLRDRLNELIADFKHFSDEMKDYRHGVRTEQQRVYIDIERLSQEWTFIEREVKKVQESLSAVIVRVDQLDRQKEKLFGGASVISWIWGVFFAILLAGLAWFLGKQA